MTPMEMGTSSEENVMISCSELSSKTRKLSWSRPVTRRLKGSVTVTFTRARSTSLRMTLPGTILTGGVSLLAVETLGGCARGEAWARAGTLKHKRTEHTNRGAHA